MSHTLELALALTVWAAAVLGCAAVSGSPARAGLTRGLGLVAWCASLLAPAGSIGARTLLSAFGMLALGRAFDLARRSGGLSFWGRVWLLIALFDVRLRVRRAPRVDLGESLWLLMHALGLGLGLLTAFALAPALDGPLAALVRWCGGLLACYALVEVVQSTLLVGYRAGGIELPRVNDFPVRSTTLAEFWGRRWNRAVSGWLNDYLFFPLARRRRPDLGIAAAFAGSTLLHFCFAWVPLDLAGAAMMAGFFVVHGLAMALERTLGVASWSLGARRAWTLAWIVVPSPLFTEPALRMLAGFA